MIDRERILRRWKPDQNEVGKLRDISSMILKKTESVLQREHIDAEPLIVGSVAKHTNVKGGDLDIFIVFSRKYTESTIGRLGLKIGHEVLPNGREKYAEHPYVSGTIDGVKIDLVPCFKIEKNSTIISSVDRTPLHTQFVLENLNENRRDEVVLLKAFMKTIGVYGSEIKTSGFSGYICELLVIHFGSFEDVIRMFSTAKGRIIIPQNSELSRKFSSPVVIIDPTDSSRNAAAAVSLENLSRMKIESKIFLRTQSLDYFRGEVPIAPSGYRERGTFMRIFRIPRPDLVDDIVYSQAKRFRTQLMDLFSSYGFYPISSELCVSDEKIDVLIELKLVRLPGTKIHIGPPVDDENVYDFIEKWSKGAAIRGPYVSDDRLCADIPVERRDIEDVVLSEIGNMNIGKHLNLVKDKIEIIDPSTTSDTYEVLGIFYSRGIL